MTREELWQLQSIQHELERRRQKELADSGDTSKSIIWLSQSYGKVIAYDSALELINEFLKGSERKCEIMKTNEVKKEPSDKRFLMEKKFSQERLSKLLQLSGELADTARTAEGSLLGEYLKVSKEVDRLIVAEAKYQEQTMPKE